MTDIQYVNLICKFKLALLVHQSFRFGEATMLVILVICAVGFATGFQIGKGNYIRVSIFFYLNIKSNL